MNLTSLTRRSLHSISMVVEDGPVLPRSEAQYARPMARQVTRVTAKTTDEVLDETTVWDIAVGFRYIKKDGNPAQLGTGSLTFYPEKDYPEGVATVVAHFLSEVGIDLGQIAKAPQRSW